MKENDVQLIHRVLSGDDEAFKILVEKYRKSVHALAWRKVGDFHFAEEITQDTFLQVHKKLSTLRNPNQFSGWLYVITNRLCKNWHRRSKPTRMQSLENMSRSKIDEFSYKCYELEQRELEGSEHRSETVKRLLQKLPESERTVVILYYLGEMTVKEIGKFLGVSVNTIKSRLQRARKRLQAQNEELLVRETLGSVQLPANLTENIVRQVTDMKSTPPQVGKPLLPWAAFGAAALLIALMLGTHNQHLARFQQPYSFEAQSEPTIELIDAVITLDMPAKPAIRNQMGRTMPLNKSLGVGLQTAETTSAATTSVDFSAKFSTSQWAQMPGPQGGSAFDIFSTSTGTLYARSSIGVYRLTAGTTVWMPTNLDIPIAQFRMPMAEHAGTHYVVSTDEVLASNDNGETWDALGSRPEGDPTGLIVIDDTTEAHNPHARVVMYIAVFDKGVFRSTDAGKHWVPLNNGLTGRTVHRLSTVENTVFAGTDRGLYRLKSGVWEQLAVDPTGVVYALAVFEEVLYVGIGGAIKRFRYPNDPPRAGRIFRSSDLGASWTEITPKSEHDFFIGPSGLKMLAVGETILLENRRLFRSRDGGRTWTRLVSDTYPYPFRFVAFNENTFYRAGMYGIYRTTNGGESWQPFMDGMMGTGALDIVAFNNRLYVHNDVSIVQSVDDGESWTTISVDTSARAPKRSKRKLSNTDFYFDSKLVIADNVLYGITEGEGENLHISHLSVADNRFVPVHGVPAFSENRLSDAVLREIGVAQGIYADEGHPKDDKLVYELDVIENHTRAGAFAVSGGTFYVEHKRKLLKWKPGESEWENTGLIDTGKRSYDGSKNGFKLAASAETVYVGKRDGRLFQSLDDGNSWRDITPSLPLRFTQFKEIIFVDSTAYVATDRGILVSQTGAYWRVLTDTAGERIVIDKFAVDGTNVYGAGNAGVYRLDDRRPSAQIYPSVPDKILALVVKDATIYIATRHQGMFQIPLEGEARDLVWR